MYCNRLALKRKLSKESGDVEDRISKMSIKMSSSISVKMSISTEHRSEHHHKTALRRFPNGMHRKVDNQSKPAEMKASTRQVKREICTMETETSAVHVHDSGAVQMHTTSKAYEKKTQTSYQEITYRKTAGDVKAHSNILKKISRSKQTVIKSPTMMPAEPDMFAECEIDTHATTIRVEDVEKSSFMTAKAGFTPSNLMSQMPLDVPVNGDVSTFKTAKTTLTQPPKSNAAGEIQGRASKLALSNSICGSPSLIVLPEGVFDFDRSNRHNPEEVSDYATDIFKHLKNREELSRIKPYMHRQPHLTSMDRALVIDWLVDVHKCLRLTHETLYMATKLLDMFLSRKVVRKDMIQMVGAAAMLLASKYDVSILIYKNRKTE